MKANYFFFSYIFSYNVLIVLHFAFSRYGFRKFQISQVTNSNKLAFHCSYFSDEMGKYKNTCSMLFRPNQCKRKGRGLDGMECILSRPDLFCSFPIHYISFSQSKHSLNREEEMQGEITQTSVIKKEWKPYGTL